MTSKPLGIMGVSRIVGWSRLQVFEALYFVSDRMVVVRTATGIRWGWGAGDAILGWNQSIKQEEHMSSLSVEELLAADINNFAVTYNKIRKVELKKFGKGAFITFYFEDKKIRWNLHRLSGSYKVEDFEAFLQTLFREKYVRKSLLKR